MDFPCRLQSDCSHSGNHQHEHLYSLLSRPEEIKQFVVRDRQVDSRYSLQRSFPSMRQAVSGRFEAGDAHVNGDQGAPITGHVHFK